MKTTVGLHFLWTLPNNGELNCEVSNEFQFITCGTYIKYIHIKSQWFYLFVKFIGRGNYFVSQTISIYMQFEMRYACTLDLIVVMA